MAETKAKPTLEELTEEIRKFNSLLQDPHPGLFSWHDWLQERCTRTKKMLEELGVLRTDHAHDSQSQAEEKHRLFHTRIRH